MKDNNKRNKKKDLKKIRKMGIINVDPNIVNLKKNIQVLTKLENDHNAEVEARKTINKNLEAEGAFTPEDKMNKLKEKIDDYIKEKR